MTFYGFIVRIWTFKRRGRAFIATWKSWWYWKWATACDIAATACTCTCSFIAATACTSSCSFRRCSFYARNWWEYHRHENQTRRLARYLYEYHDTSYTSLALPALPLDRSTVSVHAILKPDQVLQICKICIICIIWHYCIFYIFCILCIFNVNMLFRIMLYWALCVFIPPTTTGVT